PLARAVGLRGRRELRVLDATAGLGADAWVLAGLGCRVTAVERHPVVAALLADGLRRAALAGGWAAERAGRIRLVQGEAREVLEEEGPWEAACLDPMYPERRASALPRRAMRLLRELVGEDPDAGALLEAALARARRVVVKRPRRAPPLGGREPHHRVAGSSTRFDVYLSRPS
ncbi:MAG: rRNA methyltransferase, partial [Gammaproteobacteria bacterium]